MSKKSYLPAHSQAPAHGLAADLARRFAETGKPIRVGLIGSGEMGTDIVTQCNHMTGITVGAIAEINAGAAKKAYMIAGRDEGTFFPATRNLNSMMPSLLANLSPRKMRNWSATANILMSSSTPQESQPWVPELV